MINSQRLIFGFMLLATSPAVLPAALQAQEDEFETEDEEAELFFAPSEIVSSSAKHALPIEKSPSAITVITHEDIVASGANSLADLLRVVPGFEVIYSHPFFPSINFRRAWSTANDALQLLVNGQEINIELVGMPMWELVPIPLEEIERIEVVRGAASSLYGANAFTGVVCITTKELPQKTTGWVRLVGGEPASFMADAKASATFGNWGLFLSGGLNFLGMSSAPRIEGLERSRLHAGAVYQLSETEKISLNAHLVHSTGPVATWLTPAYMDAMLSSVHAKYESEQIQGQIYWTMGTVSAAALLPINFQGIHLADFKPLTLDSHTLDLQLQWTLPSFWNPLFLIIGGSFRALYAESDDLLDDETFTDRNSSRYHVPGIQRWEERLGVFLHSEISLAEWLSITAGARVDYNTVTGWFISPKAAMVFEIQPKRHFLRLGVARSFRKMSFLESDTHMVAEFPRGSPVQGPDQMLFQEFMTRVGGTNDLEEERLWAFEAGYIANFLDGKLGFSLDAYYNRFSNRINLIKNLVPNDKGWLDIEKSSMQIVNYPDFDYDAMGTELAVHFNPSNDLSFLFSWVHQQQFYPHYDRFATSNPKNMFTLGGRFLSKTGFLGSLYAFTRSEFAAHGSNPEGIDAPEILFSFHNVLQLMGKLGWKFDHPNGWEIETGLKFLLPVYPSSSNWSCFQENIGGVDDQGDHWGAYARCREITLYLQGAI